MTENLPIKNTVFDLGAVLLHWHPEEIASRHTPEPSIQQNLLDNIFYHQDWKRLDQGIIDEQQAIRCFADNTGLPLSEMAQLMSSIKDSLLAKEDTVELMMELKQRGHRLFCLSNICTGIFDFVAQRYDFFDAFEDVIVSAQVNMIKPDPEIFKYMLECFNIQPQETLFIDDLPANVVSARALGIHGIQFTNIEDCRQAIQHILGE